MQKLTVLNSSWDLLLDFNITKEEEKEEKKNDKSNR